MLRLRRRAGGGGAAPRQRRRGPRADCTEAVSHTSVMNIARAFGVHGWKPSEHGWKTPGRVAAGHQGTRGAAAFIIKNCCSYSAYCT